MLKAIIFDLNGVFVKSHEFLSERILRDFRIPEDKFIPVLNHVLNQARKPEVTESWSLWEPELKNLGIKFTREEWWDYWFRYEREDISMLNLARELKAQGMKIFIISNNFVERANYYRENFSFAYLKETADKIYFSFETGFKKPDPEAYLNILRENDLNPEDCIYFDNAPENIEAANRLGIESYLFENSVITKRILESRQ